MKIVIHVGLRLVIVAMYMHVHTTTNKLSDSI